MTVIKTRTMEIICYSLPKIASELKRIADILENNEREDDNEKTNS